MTVYGFPSRFSRRCKPFTIGGDDHLIGLPHSPDNPRFVSKPFCMMSPGEKAEAKQKNFSYLRHPPLFFGRTFGEKFKTASKTSYISIHLVPYSCEFCQIDFISVPSSFHLVHFESYRGIPPLRQLRSSDEEFTSKRSPFYLTTRHR